MSKYKILPERLFISGTDTGIGKTVVSSVLVRGLQAGYWKPVQAGMEPQTDTEFVQRVTQLENSHFYRESYKLKTPMSPHAAAAREGIKISLDKIKEPHYKQKHLIIEGAGGLIVPLNDKETMIDLIKKMDIPVLLVVKSGLGTLNHTLLSLQALRHRDIPVFGIVMNGEPHESNEEAIRNFGDINNIYRLNRLEKLNSSTLESAYNQIFN
ncbi:MAG: dethiobiotin synthase [Balneolaceae bacterium]